MGRDRELAEATIHLWDDEAAGKRISDEEIAYLAAEMDTLALHRVAPLPAGPAPAGTRSGETWESGALLVILSTAPVVLHPLVRLLQDWLTRRNSGSIHVKLKGNELRLTSTGRAEQRIAIERFYACLEDASEAARTAGDRDDG